MDYFTFEVSKSSKLEATLKLQFVCSLLGLDERWRHDRTFFNSSFSGQIIKSFIPTFVQATNRMIMKMAAFNGMEFDVLKLTELCAIEMISATSFGLEIECPGNDVLFERFLNAVKM